MHHSLLTDKLNRDDAQESRNHTIVGGTIETDE